MKRIQVYAVGILLALLPAVFGLWGNASFSKDVPVRVPDQARTVAAVAKQHPRAVVAADRAGRTPAERHHGRHHGRHGADDPATHDVGDDHGGDHGGDRAGSRHPEPSDDHGGVDSNTRSGHPSGGAGDNTSHHTAGGDSRSGKCGGGTGSGGHGSDD